MNADEGYSSGILKVKDVMVKDVVTVQSDRSVQDAAQIMNEYRIGCLVVIEGGKAVGIMTERDVLERVVAVAVDPKATLVRQIMSKPVVAVGPNAVLEDAVELMFKHRIKKLLVFEGSGTDAKFVGLVTLTDIARIYPTLIKMLKGLFEARGEDPPMHMEKVMNYYIV